MRTNPKPFKKKDLIRQAFFNQNKNPLDSREIEKEIDKKIWDFKHGEISMFIKYYMEHREIKVERSGTGDLSLFHLRGFTP